jgi:hypothetical protein
MPPRRNERRIDLATGLRVEDLDLQPQRAISRFDVGARWLPAVRNTRVYAVDANSYFARPGPRLVEGTELLAHLLHPALFEWNGPRDAFRSVVPSVMSDDLRPSRTDDAREASRNSG